MLSVTDRAQTSLYCATSDAPEVAATSGQFYDRCAPRAASAVATPELARAAVGTQRAVDRGLSRRVACGRG